MNYQDYWTGLANLVSDGTYEMPENAIGMITRFVTFATNYDDFLQKANDVAKKSGLKLIFIEEPERVNAFLKHQWATDDHEIYELLEQAEKIKENVVCGEFHYYTHNDA